MPEIVTLVVPVTTTGSAGSAAGAGSTGAIKGFLLDIYLDFNASAPATTDTTITLTGRGGNVLAVSNSVTDALFAPRQKPVDNANAAITNAFEPFALTDGLTITLAQCDALAPALTAYVRVLTP
jgi:hypothetical protein